MGLFYNNFLSIFEGYTDATWITNIGDQNPTCGWIFILGGEAISWISKKQTMITHSTIEGKFITLASTCREAK